MENRIFKFVCDCIGIIIGVAIAVLFWTGVYYIVCYLCGVAFIW